MERDHRIGWLLAAVGMLLVSTDSLFVRLAEAPALDVAFLVAVLSFPLQAGMGVARCPEPVLAHLRRWSRPLAVVAVVSSLTQLAFIAAVTNTSVANVVSIVAAAPVFAALAGWLVFGERTSARVWLAITVSILGVLIVVAGSLGQPTLSGDLLAFLAIVGFAFTINLWRRFPEMNVFVGLAGSALVMAAASAPFADPFGLDARAYAASAAMGLAFNPLGRIAHSSAARFAPAAEVALFAPVETVAATVWAWLAFSEAPPAQTVVGATVIVASLALATVGRNR